VIGARRGQGTGASEDIPVARRSTVSVPSRSRGFRRLATGAAGALLGLLGLALVFPQPLRRLLGPPPVAGLNVRAGMDGRLLGHFPYPEAKLSELVAITPGVELQRDAADALVVMQSAAASDGVDLVVLSGYRSLALQKQLFFEVKSARNQTARERALVSAPPGFSEHATGFAIDLGDGSQPGANLSQSFEQTAAFSWLKVNGARYQFVLSFPEGNRQGVSYEPWHWRYEGTTQALQMFEPAQRLNR